MKRQVTEPGNVALEGDRPQASPNLSRSNEKTETLGDQEVQRPNTFRRLWNGWLKIAEVIGTVQMVIILTLVYWTMITVMAIPFRFFSDPLALKGGGRPRWIQRVQPNDILENMRRQF